MMPLRGVRSSWLTLLMKASFCATSARSSAMSCCRDCASMLRMSARRRMSRVTKLEKSSTVEMRIWRGSGGSSSGGRQ